MARSRCQGSARAHCSDLETKGLRVRLSPPPCVRKHRQGRRAILTKQFILSLVALSCATVFGLAEPATVDGIGMIPQRASFERVRRRHVLSLPVRCLAWKPIQRQEDCRQHLTPSKSKSTRKKPGCLTASSRIHSRLSRCEGEAGKEGMERLLRIRRGSQPDHRQSEHGRAVPLPACGLRSSRGPGRGAYTPVSKARRHKS
jgi:hypothetical protein